ncbi:NAD(P)/FAD-dependent oxidoreductase [Geobacter sp. DSM 9736]|uniref:NAD(P)/FAD-dependent oxidoreductase n=1 Tax=Geobacter sp. DSM 9736 TaxID=1277350 RepID=UPI000B4FDFD6|nr:NAD(P)/FAD-dependent oxidoreductase [Geobacter sp. DSM 9736]SNB48091.1 Thioredoxin reductase [Geobacter sp. DSM 9736]
MLDVLVAGGGIAGLSAALILGRCRRRVLVVDSGRPRNLKSSELHGFLSRDGIDPLELRSIGRQQLERYTTVSYRSGTVVDAEDNDEQYRVTLDSGEQFSTRYLLIATGLIDLLPPVAGIEDFYGRSVFHCPYCDGWERRDQPLAAYGDGAKGAEYALELTGWSSDIVLCTDGGPLPPPEQLSRLERNGIGLRSERIARLSGEMGRLEAIEFEGAPPLPRNALFFSPGQFQASPLAEKLRCSVTEGVVNTAKFQQVHSRLFVAGDAARSVQLAIVAAAEGVEAAFAINTALLKENLR